MIELKVNYSPGFQEDLTSWSLHIDGDGSARQLVNVRLFSPPEQRRENHEFRLMQAELLNLNRLVHDIDFQAVSLVAAERIIDDAEHIEIAATLPTGKVVFVAPLEVWAWEAKKGEALSKCQLSAVALWKQVESFSRYPPNRSANQ